MYNVPSRTSANITAETTLKLAHDFKNIVAIKEASGNLDQISEIIKSKPDEFLVLSGDDALALPLIALGANGIISVTANAYPQEFSAMISNALQGNFIDARKQFYLLKEFIHTLFCDGNPAGIKAALSIMGIVENNLRLPLTAVNKSTMNKLKTIIDEYKVAIH